MGAPFLLVDLDRPESPPPPLPAGPARVVAGVAVRPVEVPEEDFDVLLTAAADAPRPWVACADPYATARRLAEVVACRTEAAVTLVQLLRMARRLDPSDRLVAESIAYSVLQSGAAFRAWLASAPRRRFRPGAEPVRLARRGGRLSVTLDRPWVRNAMDAATRDGLCEALAVAAVDPSVTHVDLRGNGPAFCSGGDLAEFGTARDPAHSHLVRVRRSPAAELLRLGTRVTAWVHGACVGAGIELAAFADRVVAAPDTRIRLPELRMGLIPGAGGTASIPARVGRHRAGYLALTGETLTARQALGWGLVDDVESFGR